MYSNPVTQLGTLNKDFGTVSQMDLTGSLVLSVVQAATQTLHSIYLIVFSHYSWQ